MVRWGLREAGQEEVEEWTAVEERGEEDG